MDFSYKVVNKRDIKVVDKTVLNSGISIEKLLKMEKIFKSVYVPKKSNKVVTKVSVIELKDFSSWITGEELVLTTLENFPTKELQLSLIKQLINGGVTCIAFHPGNANLQLKILTETIEYAKRFNFPIFQLSGDCTYAEIIDLLYNIEIKEYKDKMSTLNKVNQLLFYYLSQNLTLDKLLRNIGELTSLQFLVLDLNMISVSSSFVDNSYLTIIDSDEFKRFMNNEKIIKLLTDGNSIVITLKDNSKKMKMFAKPIKDNQYVKQILIVIGNIEQSTTDKVIKSIESALSLKIGQSLEDKINLANIANYELLERNNPSKAHFFYRELGYTLNDKMIVFVMDINKSTKNISNNHTSYLDNLILRIINQVNFYLGEGGFATWYKDHFVIFFSPILNQNYKNASIELVNFMNLTFPFLKVNIGTASKDTRNLSKAYHEAVLAMKTAKQSNKQIEYFENIGILPILNSLEDHFYIKKFYQNTLQPILTSDDEKSNELIKTLEVFLDNNLNYKDTAERLFVHPNTVRYRIRKIKELYNEEDLFVNSERRLNLSFAIKLLNYNND